MFRPRGHPLLKIEQFSMFYETIDNDDYSENMLYSLIIILNASQYYISSNKYYRH